jgi:hypothetical protein
VKLVKNDRKSPLLERTLNVQPVSASSFSEAGFNVSVELIGNRHPWQGCGLVLNRGEVAAVVAEMVAWLASVQPSAGAQSSEPETEGLIDQDTVRDTGKE